MNDPVKHYIAAIEQISLMYHYDYVNEELEQLMQHPNWKAFYRQALTTRERKQIQSYQQYAKDRKYGYLDFQITALEALVERIKKLWKKA